MTEKPVSAVTGGTSGIGRAIALALARRGDHVIVLGRNRDRLESVLAEMRRDGDGRHTARALDVADPADMEAFSDLCRSEYGRVDALIASAAIGRSDPKRLPGPTRDLSLAEWEAVIRVNLHGVFLSNKAVLPLMKARGEGVIVNICSSTTPHGLRGRALAPAYSATKFAVAEYSRALAAEMAPHGVRVTAVYPGTVETPLIADTALGAPFGGTMTPESLAEAVLGLIELGGEAEIVDPHILPRPAPRRQAGAAPDREYFEAENRNGHAD